MEEGNSINTGTVRRQRAPQVLLLGNGIIRSYSLLALSWQELLLKIGTNESLPRRLDMPMPLEIVLRTEDSVNTGLKRHCRELYGEVRTEEFRNILLSLLDAGFDHILTTNYSYELEEAALGITSISERQLADLRRQTITIRSHSEEARYRLHTYHRVETAVPGYASAAVIENPETAGNTAGDESVRAGVFNRKKRERGRQEKARVNRIWHIHGEASDPQSMILGHYYYGNLLSLCREHIESSDRIYSKPWAQRAILSWVDAFVMGDVYVLGFGYDFSEMDLWWLLDAKKELSARRSRQETKDSDPGREADPGGDHNGRLYYYRPAKEQAFDVKQELMKVYGAEVLDCGARETGDEERDKKMYRQFYRNAIEDIRHRMRRGRSQL